MKRLSVLIISLFFTICLYSQSFKAYRQITYSPIPRTVTIIVGDTAVIPKDSKGQPLQFNTIISVLNWLSKKGWHVEPIDMNSNTQQSYSFLLSRDNTTDKELGSMFN